MHWEKTRLNHISQHFVLPKSYRFYYATQIASTIMQFTYLIIIAVAAFVAAAHIILTPNQFDNGNNEEAYEDGASAP
jgi:hypothetical protein